MDGNSVTAGNAQTEIQSLMKMAAYHKTEIRTHRRLLRECLRNAEGIRRRNAEALGIEVVVVPPQAHSQEAKSNARRIRPRT